MSKRILYIEDNPDNRLLIRRVLQAAGYEVTARLKQLPGLNRIPIIAVTANVMKGDREKTLAAGCDGYIQKPIDIDLLPEQIERFLKKGSSND
jgi:two-component system cell cycle response regulator DivK